MTCDTYSLVTTILFLPLVLLAGLIIVWISLLIILDLRDEWKNKRD